MKYLKTIILMFIVLTLSACHQDASDELKEELFYKNVETTVNWVKENIEGASDITADIEYGGAYRVFADLCNGTYTRNGKNCKFMFNPEIRDFATDEFYEEVTQRKTELIKEDLPVSFVYENIEISYEDEIISCHYVSDQNALGKTDVNYEAYDYELSVYTHLTDIDNLDEYAYERIAEEDITIRFVTDGFEKVHELFDDLEFIMAKSNWMLEFLDKNTEEKISCIYENNSYFMIYEHTNDNGELVLEVLNQR